VILFNYCSATSGLLISSNKFHSPFDLNCLFLCSGSLKSSVGLEFPLVNLAAVRPQDLGQFWVIVLAMFYVLALFRRGASMSSCTTFATIFGLTSLHIGVEKLIHVH